MTDNTLVFPSPTYDQSHERQRNRRIEEVLRSKLNRDQMGIFSGVPSLMITGSNASFEIPVGSTPTVLPFDTILLNRMDANAVVGSGLSPSYDMDVMVSFRLRHAASAGGNVDVMAHSMVNGVVFETYAYTARLDTPFDVSDTFYPRLTGGDVFRLGFTHNRATPMVLDITKSRIVVMQLTVNPAYVDNSRV